jgi:hypothetical protein
LNERHGRVWFGFALLLRHGGEVEHHLWGEQVAVVVVAGNEARKRRLACQCGLIVGQYL